jgi:hypothetical protein
MSINELIQSRREELLQVAARHGVKSIRVFGSFARGDARPDSDLDLLIEAGPERTAFFPGGLVADLEALLGRRVDVATEEGLNINLKARVLREAVPL